MITINISRVDTAQHPAQLISTFTSEKQISNLLSTDVELYQNTSIIVLTGLIFFFFFF